MSRLRAVLLAAMAMLAPLAGARAEAWQREAIRQELAALAVPPRDGTLVVEKALAAQAALLRNEPAEAARIAAGVMAESRMGPWGEAPFSAFMAAIVLPDNDAFRAGVDALLALEPGNAFALNLRALYFIETAWARRSHGYARALRPDQAAGFAEYRPRAIEAIETALAARDDLPYSHLLRLRILAAEGNTPRLEAAFRKAIARFPGYYPLYVQRLGRLGPKWGGSVPAMVEFVQRHAEQAPAGAPMRMLHIVLYGQLIDAAAGRCEHVQDPPEAKRKCVAVAMAETTPPGLEDRIVATLRLHKSVDPFAFARELSTVLMDMVRTGGAEAYAGSLLELASEFMGSDNRLMRPEALRGNHFLDLAAAEIWRRAGMPENAQTKLRHALEDFAATAFPDIDTRAAALAGISDRMADLAWSQRDHVRTVAYIEAAIAAGGDLPERRRYLACRAYHELGLFAEGISLCTRLPGGSGDTPTLYWRAMNEDRAGEADAAMAHFARLAPIPDEYGSSSAIRITLLLARRGDYRGMVALLNGYPYLFNERSQSRQNIAVAYNNRCYALMELGEYEKALRDCTASLTYWNIPDAFTKQQKLVRLLQVKRLPPM